MTVNEITTFDLKRKLDMGDDIYIFDIRTPEEFELGHVDMSILIPFSELEEHLSDFDKQKEYVISCGLGGKALEAVLFMNERGFDNVKFLIGGYHQWMLDNNHKN